MITNLITNKKVLFVNGIRLDVNSGGATSSRLLISEIRNSASSYENVDLVITHIKWNFFKKYLFIFFNFPAPLFVFLSKIKYLNSFNYFSRLSFYYFILLIFKKLFFKPDYIIFNYHPSFIYSLIFKNKIFVWHDLPSIHKYVGSRYRPRISIYLENFYVLLANFNIVFSYKDKRAMQLLHHVTPFTQPVITTIFHCRKLPIDTSKFLLIGNWSRPENTIGASIFFKKYINLINNSKIDNVSKFTIAGFSSKLFFNSLIEIDSKFNQIVSYRENFKNFDDFDDFCLLAPIDRGAGIKLKTIEAWSVGMPVIGTSQAFSGLSKKNWSNGGLAFSSIESLVLAFTDRGNLDKKISNLNVELAYKLYFDSN